MILPDTSAWVEYIRGTGHPVHLHLARLIALDADIVTTEVVIMELLAGAASDRSANELSSALGEFPVVPAVGVDDHREAALLYRRCRADGETIRSINDCLIAAIAIRTRAAVLRVDRDFDALARVGDLRIEPAP